MLMPWLISHLALLLGFALALPVIAQMVRQRRSPAASLAWLLAIVLVPYVGIPLYLALGGRKMRRLASDKTALQLAGQLPALPEPHLEIDRLLRSYGMPGACAGNRIEFLRTGEEGYAGLVGLIGRAQDNICVSTFTLSPDETGRAIIELLADKAAAGVEVRVLLDGVGSLHTRKRDLATLLDAGGAVAFFMPVLHRPFRGRSNLRNHRKAVIVDGCQVWAGGSNIAREYIGTKPETERWCDLTFLLQGPAALHYLSIFHSDWKFATGKPYPVPENGDSEAAMVGSTTVQVVPSGPDVKGDPLHSALVSAVFGASRLLWIVTPYFVPDDTLVQGLLMAVHRGVEVKLLLPEKSNHPVVDMARGPYLRDLQEAGAQVYLYRGAMMHAKALLADETLAVIGSANFDMRSLFLNYETGLLLYDKDEIASVRAWIEGLVPQCRNGVPEVNTLRDLNESVARMLAPML